MKTMKTITIDGDHLKIEEIVAVARQGALVELAPSARKSIARSREWVENIISREEPVYGINTGFGIFAEQKIPSEDSAKTQP